jgi:hypothetical protein
MNSIGFDPSADEVYVHFENVANFLHVYDRNGTFLRTMSNPNVNGNDSDIEFADETINVNGVDVSANTVLWIQNEFDPPTIYAINKSTGATIASQAFSTPSTGQWVGGAWSHDNNLLYVLNWVNDQVHVVDPSDGSIDNTFPVTPSGAPSFDVYYGDIDVLRADGNLYIVSSSQDVIRVLSPTGTWIEDISVSGLAGAMSGIAFDDLRGEAWISGVGTETVYRLGGFAAIPEPTSLALLAGSVSLLLSRHRRGR